ncbi:potassium/proton antiporter [Hyphococcus sp. DH-69]|uniref:potassium/proton antiporter n=1 Tax=Hyphococcus formosus TaxID=3143534 RepID=UPI00398AEABA
MIDAINLAILIGAGLVILSTLTSLVSQRIGAPLLLVFLGIGLLAGQDGLLGIQFNSGGTAYFIGSLALAIILFDSGFETPLRSYRLAAAPALTLATLGVVLTAGLIGVAAHFLFGVSWVEGFLLGSIVASTDAAAVFFLLRVGGLKLRDKVKATLEVESGANDPMAIFLTAMFVELAAAQNNPDFGFNLGFIWAFIEQIGLGLVIGVIGGAAVAALLNRLRSLDAGLFPIAGLSTALVVFAASGLLGGSGFLSAYVAGVVAGNRRVIFPQRIRRFQVGMTWLAQIGMFLTLGLLATPSEFGAIILPAIALAIVLIFFARPIAVWLCLLPFKFKWREKLFVGWVGLRGAVSIMLAILPGLGGVQNGETFFNIVFVMVLASLLIQGWTISFAAHLLNMLRPHGPGLLDRIELELPGDAELELVSYRIHPESSVAIGERVPRWARPVLIMRGSRTYSIHNIGHLKADDRVYLFASPRQLDILDKIYASPADPENPSLYGDFVFDGDIKVSDIAQQYGIQTVDLESDETVGQYLEREFSGEPVVGDRLSVGNVDLVVTAVLDDMRVEKVGLIVDPESIERPSMARRFTNRVRQSIRKFRSRKATDPAIQTTEIEKPSQAS